MHNCRTIAPISHMGGVPLPHMEWGELVVPGDSEKKEALRPDGQYALNAGHCKEHVPWKVAAALKNRGAQH